MQLLELYNNLRSDKWKYYEALKLQEKDEVLSHFDVSHCQAFITNEFLCGGKEDAFDISFFKEYLKKGKHEHTVSLYFLGCCFQEIVDNSLKEHLNLYIPNAEQWYDFRYTWYLTCLYHDTASSVEKENWRPGCPSDLDFYLGNENVEYNVFEHDWGDFQEKPYTYGEKLVKNYFKYRVEHCHSIDHGIIAGFVLYDRLVKNYNKAWTNHLVEVRDLASSKENFEYNGLIWRKEHISHFAIVADAIIAHNIWLSGTKAEAIKLYKHYGLNPLVSTHKNNNKLTLKDNPLVFFLDLFDTIEPVKFFSKHSMTSQTALESVEFWKQENQLTIDMLQNSSILSAWHKTVKSTKDWLDIGVSLQKSNQKNSAGSITILFQDD